MLRLIEAFFPERAPVKAKRMTCSYQAQKEGVFAELEFEVTAEKGVEAVEFTFVLFDIFDVFLGSMQGIAGPGKYQFGAKRNKARWVFVLDGAFSQYHALCFPSQARLLDGTVWRCDRAECLRWLNATVAEGGATVTEDEVFPEEVAHAGIQE